LKDLNISFKMRHKDTASWECSGF